LGEHISSPTSWYSRLVKYSTHMLNSVEGFVLTIISILVIGVFWWAIYAFFQAIYLFIFSAGDADKIKKAWNSIRFMVLGIFLTLFFLFVFPIIFKRIQLPGYEAYTANNVFAHTSYILRSLFSFWKEAASTYQLNGPAAGGGFDPYSTGNWTQPLVPWTSWGGATAGINSWWTSTVWGSSAGATSAWSASAWRLEL